MWMQCVGAVTRESAGNGDARGDVEMSDANGSAEASTAKKAGKRDLHVGHFAMHYRRDDMEVLSPFENGIVSDWDVMEGLWSYTFKERLQIDPTEHPVLLAEPNFNTKAACEKALQILFETFNPPAIFFSKNAALSSYAAGRPTSLVLDIGYEGTVAAAVHDGYVLERSICRSKLSGNLLTECMRRCVEKSSGVTIKPPYAFERKEKVPGSGEFEVTALDFPKTHESYRRWCVESIVADLKESVCRVSESAFDEKEHANIPMVTYELPDGTEVQIGSDRFKVPEVLFNTKVLATFPDAATMSDAGAAMQCATELVMQSVAKVDVDVRKELYSGIILTGGSSMLPNARERLEREVMESAPGQARVKVIASQNAYERKFGVWIGGSILASLGSFQQCWMSKQEYEEKGASFIHLKAP